MSGIVLYKEGSVGNRPEVMDLGGAVGGALALALALALGAVAEIGAVTSEG